MKRHGLGSIALAAGFAVLLTVSPVLAEPTIADIQWAQGVLKQNGFAIGGRANGKMTPATRSALKSYQKSVGIPVTGNLDHATIDRMLADRKPSATQGTLSAPKPGSVKRAPQQDVKPKAAPTLRVETGNGGENVDPALAPRGALDLGPSGQRGDGVAIPLSMPNTEQRATGESFTTVVLRALVAAAFFGTVLVLAGTWWVVGRRRRKKAGSRMAGRRLEPTFGPSDGPRVDGRPPLSARRPARS